MYTQHHRPNLVLTTMSMNAQQHILHPCRPLVLCVVSLLGKLMLSRSCALLWTALCSIPILRCSIAALYALNAVVHPLVGAGGPYPDGAPDAATHLRNVFHRMGLSDQEIVALSGAHTLGRSYPSRSGFGKLMFLPHCQHHTCCCASSSGSAAQDTSMRGISTLHCLV